MNITKGLVLMSEIIGGKRYCGKTTQLIARSHKENIYILCGNQNIAKMIFDTANEMGLSIPYPITTKELPLSKGSSIREVLIDEVEMVLHDLLGGLEVKGMSTSYKLNELDSLRKQ